jgi:hypothetical protein
VDEWGGHFFCSGVCLLAGGSRRKILGRSEARRVKLGLVGDWSPHGDLLERGYLRLDLNHLAGQTRMLLSRSWQAQPNGLSGARTFFPYSVATETTG